MINLNILSRTALVLSCVLFAGLSCRGGTDPKPTPKPLDLLEPVGGAHYKVGDTMHIRWETNDSTYISSVKVLLLPLFPVNPIGGGSFPLDTTIYLIIDSTHVSNNCYIKISDYLDPNNPRVPPDSSGLFSITLN